MKIKALSIALASLISTSAFADIQIIKAALDGEAQRIGDTITIFQPTISGLMLYDHKQTALVACNMINMDLVDYSVLNNKRRMNIMILNKDAISYHSSASGVAIETLSCRIRK